MRTVKIILMATLIVVMAGFNSCDKKPEDKPIEVASVTITPPASATLTVGGTTLTLTVTVEPATAADKSVTWKSSTDAVATVDAAGKVTPVSAGTATITATASNGKTSSITITVQAAAPPFVAVTGISGVPTTAVINVELTLTGTVAPANATNKTIVWSTATAGATITNGNKFKATAAGAATVTTTITNGASATANYTQTFNITVSEAGGSGGEDGNDGIVSKEAETSTMLLEEFSGIGCTYCPDGNKRADYLAEDVTFKGKFFIINVHAGSYAAPTATQPDDLRTDFGSALVTYGKVTAYPAGMINRSVPAVGRGDWAAACTKIANNPTYVNVAAKTTINSADRTLSCRVQVYYTSDAPVAVNHVNVAVLQNEIIANQTGGETYYPEMLTGDGKYRHMHVLRHLVTGQWGEAIESEKKKDNLYEKTFTWTIPAEMKTIPIPLQNVEVLVFVTEGQEKPVVKVCKSSIEIK